MKSKRKPKVNKTVNASCKICVNCEPSMSPSHLRCKLENRETFATRYCEYFKEKKEYKNYYMLEPLKEETSGNNGVNFTNTVSVSRALIFALITFILGLMIATM